MSNRAIRAATAAPADEPIDVDHLRAQTCGDTALEADLLELFSRQARLIVRDLVATTPASVPQRRDADLLHTLCGSARAVGAWEVAIEAEQLERVARATAADNGTAERPYRPATTAALDASVERACRAIDDMRASASIDGGERPPTRR